MLRPDTSSARSSRFLLGVGIGMALVLLIAVVLWTALRGGSLVTEEAVRTTVLATIQSESPEEFLVTGTLSSSVASEGARRWRIRALNVETGRSTVRVEVPGRMAYGFRLDALRPSDIRFLEGGVVEIQMPELSVFSVEPELESARVTVDVEGVGRVAPDLSARTMEQTLRTITPALRKQAEDHLATNNQPRIHTAEALRRMLSTPLEAAGVEGARFRFVLAPGDTLDLGPDGRRRTVVRGAEEGRTGN